MNCKGRIFDSDLKEIAVNPLDDFSGVDYLFEEFYALDIYASKVQPKLKKEKGKWVMVLSEFDHLKDDLKKNFLAKVLSSIGVNLKDVLVHYQDENSNLEKLHLRYKSSIIFLWSDELNPGENYYETKGIGDNSLFYIPSLSNVMSDKNKKVALWTVLKRDFVNQV